MLLTNAFSLTGFLLTGSGFGAQPLCSGTSLSSCWSHVLRRSLWLAGMSSVTLSFPCPLSFSGIWAEPLEMEAQSHLDSFCSLSVREKVILGDLGVLDCDWTPLRMYRWHMSSVAAEQGWSWTLWKGTGMEGVSQTCLFAFKALDTCYSKGSSLLLWSWV